MKFQTENQPWFIRNFSWFHTIVTYVIRSSFQQLFLKFQTENKAWHQKFFINMIPYHCDICDTKFVSTASFEIQKKETRLEFSSEILLVKTRSDFLVGDSFMFLQNRLFSIDWSSQDQFNFCEKKFELGLTIMFLMLFLYKSVQLLAA